MKTYVPSYYKSFTCIADKCRHSCCIGWEIDIDEKSLDRYLNEKGKFGDRLKKNISFEDTPHFVLSADERCPFLDECGLCDIYKELGEDALCNICTDHPRFRNFYSDRTEMGLGMCCEEVTRLILSQKDNFLLETLDGSEKLSNTDVFLEERQHIFDILSDKTLPFKKRTEKLGVNIPQKSFSEWIEFYLSLEILDSRWQELLMSIKDKEPQKIIDDHEDEFVSLMTYFVYRHLAEDEIKLRLAFCLHCTKMIADIFSLSSQKSFEELCDIARMFSSEIEYSEDNTDELIFLMSI